MRCRALVGGVVSGGLGVMLAAAYCVHVFAAVAFRKSDHDGILLRARAGDAKAQYEMGRMYERGIEVRQNSKEAARWYRRAADQGVPEAQYKLWRLFADGDGVKRSLPEAHKWLRKAATQGYSIAQNRLGQTFEHGQGVPRDTIEAYKWYTLAAASSGSLSAAVNRDALAARMTDEEMTAAKKRIQIFSTTPWVQMSQDDEARRFLPPGKISPNRRPPCL